WGRGYVKSLSPHVAYAISNGCAGQYAAMARRWPSLARCTASRWLAHNIITGYTPYVCRWHSRCWMTSLTKKYSAVADRRSGEGARKHTPAQAADGATT